MELKTLRKKSEQELAKMITDQKKSVEKLMGDVYKGKEKNLAKIKLARKEVARLKTILREKKN